jgi:7-carboxy-7-deazaguanine synthase
MTLKKAAQQFKHLFLTEIYESIQGESRFSGYPTLFIRLSGCNLRCSWCDTTYSFAKGEKYSLELIYNKIATYSSKHICITGGEPLLQEPVYELMSYLCSKKYIVSLETSGSKSIEKVDPKVSIILDIKCPSSGMENQNMYSNLSSLRKLDEIKFVIASEEDYLFSLEVCKKHFLFERPADVLFSPEFDSMSPKILTSWILRDKIPVKLNLQIHKYIWSSKKQGV